MLSLLTTKANNDIKSLLETSIHIVIGQYKLLIENLKQEKEATNKQMKKANGNSASIPKINSNSFKPPQISFPKL